MKAVTLHQPWASLIALGVKTIETRGWSTKHRGRIAIHAGVSTTSLVRLHQRAGRHDREAIAAENYVVDAFGTDWSTIPRGAIVATATLLDCVPILGTPPERTASTFITDHGDDEGDLPHQQGGLWLIGVNNLTAGRPTRIEDQRPLGDFTPGRYAWLLTEIEQCEPVPAKGKQGLWEWTP